MAFITFQPSDHFNNKLYTGNGSSLAVTGVGFQPDWLWIKQRNTTRSHQLMDAIRGAAYRVHSDQDVAQSSGALTSFDSDGFTVDGTSLNGTNQSGGTYVSWNWKANGSGSANTDGSISSTVSANTTAGFSIVKYTGTGSNATVGHGLNSAPKFMIIKNYSIDVDFGVYNGVSGATKNMRLNTNEVEDTGSTIFNDTDPTSSVFSVGTANLANGSGNSHIAYCFEEKRGFSKFGKYIGNGNADGTFVYTGFRPAWLLIKRADVAEDWILHDNKIDPFNEINSYLLASTNNAETTASVELDFLSNGFKFTGTSQNVSGSRFIYAAFAEHPLVSSNDIPGVAR